MTDATASADSGQGAGSTSATQSTTAALNVTPAQTNLPSLPSISWLEGADETTVGYVQNKGWSDPKQVLEGYRNLEKLLGADKAGNAVVVPRLDADAKEWAPIWDRLGRPPAADGYARLEGGDPELQNNMYSKFHELGLTKTQGEAVANWIAELGAQDTQQSQQQAQARFQEEDMAVRQEWGAAYNQNIAQAQAAARGLGLDAETIDKLSEAMGHRATLNLLQRIGSRMGEDTFVSGERTESFGNALTPGQAKAQIQSLMTDRDFTTRYMAGDAAARAKMESLHKFAYPEG